MKNDSQYLLGEQALIIQPIIATSIGLNEAVFLQQINYWLQKSPHIYDGRRWVYNSYAEWHAQMPFFSISTIRRIVENLREQKLLITGNYNKSKMLKTTWYSIDYDVLDSLIEVFKLSKSCVQLEQMEVPNLSTTIPETTQRLQTETTNTLKGGVSNQHIDTFEVEGFDVVFDELFELYPNKAEREKAYQFWVRKNYTPEQITEIREGVIWNTQNNRRWIDGYAPNFVNCLRNKSYAERLKNNLTQNPAGWHASGASDFDYDSLVDDIKKIQI